MVSQVKLLRINIYLCSSVPDCVLPWLSYFLGAAAWFLFSIS